MWVTCALGPYNFEFMTEVKREIMTRYKRRRHLHQPLGRLAACAYCEHCRTNFQAATGLELPRTDDPQDPARRAYILWRQERLFELWRLWDDEVRKINPDSCVIPNTGGGATSSLDMKRIGELAPTLIADRQARRGVMAPWANGKSGKEFRATMGRKPIVGIFSVGLEEPYRWKDSVQSAAEIRLWAIDGIANGLRPWFTKFAGSINDPRWLKPVEELYALVRGERAIPAQRAPAGARRRSSTRSRRPGSPAPSARAPHGRRGQRAGITRSSRRASRSRWCTTGCSTRRISRRSRRSILPNIAALSDAQCAQLRAFVERGGGLVATYETSLYDEWGAKRKDFGLADLFGVQFRGPDRRADAQRVSAARARPREGQRAARADSRTRRASSTASTGSTSTPTAAFGPAPLTLIPSYPDLPMEKVYPRVPRTDVAQVFLREVGRGRVVYFPWDIDRTFWEVLAADHGTLLRNAVDVGDERASPS